LGQVHSAPTSCLTTARILSRHAVVNFGREIVRLTDNHDMTSAARLSGGTDASRKTGLVSMVSARALKVAIRSSLSGLLHHQARVPSASGLAGALRSRRRPDPLGTRCSEDADCVAPHLSSAERNDQFSPCGFDCETAVHPRQPFSRSVTALSPADRFSLEHERGRTA
jgi:hypothetical protein